MKNIAWSWRSAGIALVAMLPSALLITSGNTTVGLVAAIGIAIAGALQLPPTHKQRLIKLPLTGFLIGCGLVVGSVLSHNPVVASVGIGVLAFGVSWLATTHTAKLGAMLTSLLPIVAIGFSYNETSEAVFLALIITLGALWMAVLSLLLPATTPVAAPVKPAKSKASIRTYGVIYGLTATVATAIPFIAGWQHVGWVAGSTLLVMRPSWQLEQLRAIGRASSVAIGALAAAVILTWQLNSPTVAALIAVAVIAACGTRGSKWYILPGFMTFIVFFILLYGKIEDGAIAGRLGERIGEVILGIAIALTAGVIIRHFTKK